MEACSSWKQTSLPLRHPLPSLFSPRAYELVFHWWFTYLESPHLDCIMGRLCERRWASSEGTVPSWSHSVYWFDQFSYFLPVLFLISLFGCHLFCVSCHKNLSGPFTFTVCLISISLLLYLAHGLLSWWASPLPFTLFESEKAKSLQSFNEKWTLIIWGK